MWRSMWIANHYSQLATIVSRRHPCSTAALRSAAQRPLTRHRAGQQRLAGAGRPSEQHALGQLAAEARELLGALQVLHNLLHTAGSGPGIQSHFPARYAAKRAFLGALTQPQPVPQRLPVAREWPRRSP